MKGKDYYRRVRRAKREQQRAPEYWYSQFAVSWAKRYIAHNIFRLKGA